MDETLRTWGSNIRTFRTVRGFSQETLAEKVEVTQATVARWEAGLMEPRRAAKVRLATVLGTDVAVLFPLMRTAVA